MKRGSMVLLDTLKIWSRAEQLDAQGRLRPFFPRPGTGRGGGPVGFNGRRNAPQDLYPPVLPD